MDKKIIITAGKERLKLGKITHIMSVQDFDVSPAGVASKPVRIVVLS